MKPSRAGPSPTGVYFYFPPSRLQKVECPQIFEVCDAFSAEYEEIGVEELRAVVGSFPGGIFSLGGKESRPMFGLPVEEADIVVSRFVRPASSEEDQLFSLGTKMQRGIGAYGRDLSFCLDFGPNHGDRIVGP